MVRLRCSPGSDPARARRYHRGNRGEKMSIRHAVTVATLCALAPLNAAAQSYPDRPIRVIVGVPAGGTPDVMARTVTTGMSKILGQPLVMDNRGGAGGLIGTEVAAKAAPDGYTLLVSSPGPLTILPHVHAQIAYDPLRDFTPIGLIASN